MAKQDLKAIQAYLESTNSPKPRRQVLQLIDLIEGMLTQFPNLGRAGSLADTRERFIKGLPYRVIYTLSPLGKIKILAILHNAQQSPGGF